MNRIRRSFVNEDRINGSTKSKVSNIIRTVIRVGDSNGFPFGVKEADTDHVVNVKN